MNYTKLVDGQPVEMDEQEIADLEFARAAEGERMASEALARTNAAVRLQSQVAHLRADFDAKISSNDLAGAMRLLDQIHQLEKSA